MKTEKIHVNDYASKLIADNRFRKIEYIKYVDNCYMLHNVWGNIDSSILNAVICKAKWNRKIRRMLIAILSYVNTDSITDENFRMILRFPRQKRKSYLDAIGHMELAFYQMQIINSIASSFEVFAWLFERICENDFFQEEDMLQILREASDITSFGIRTCVESARQKYGTSSKLNIADAWIEKMND